MSIFNFDKTSDFLDFIGGGVWYISEQILEPIKQNEYFSIRLHLYLIPVL